MDKKYEYDVQYDVWMMGGNPDEVDTDRTEDCYDDGLYSEEAAQIEISVQLKKREKKMKKRCRTCRQEFDGADWMKQCYDCYKDFKGLKRIQLLEETGYARGVFIVTHPDVSKDELNEYIKKRFGSVFTPENWGAVEVPKRKLKLWWNSQNSD